MPASPPPDTLIWPNFSGHPDRYNVQRLKPIALKIEDANLKWQAKLAGTVWANYQLVMVEWPGVGSAPGSNALDVKPDPPSFNDQQSNLVNTTMETFLQKEAGPNDGIKFTCMGCHNKPQALDYVFTIALNAKKSHAMGPSLTRRAVIDYLTSVVLEPAAR
jgi:hypothetical protein